jgi:hypothetical protein
MAGDFYFSIARGLNPELLKILTKFETFLYFAHMTLAQKILDFNANLNLKKKLPNGIRVMNPFKDEGHERVNAFCKQFYEKFYNDEKPRELILGINPGRHGAGLTGIPFTDAKRLESHCGIDSHGLKSHEPSCVYVYEMIDAFGGPEAFYSKFFVNSICPLGFVITNDKGREVNYNYYDLAALQEAVTPFIKRSIKQMIALGMKTEKVYCWGTGKNYKFLLELNKKQKYFGEIIPLEHPRYIMQYKTKKKEEYIDKYLKAFKS